MGLLHGWVTCPRCASALANDGMRAECGACGSVYWTARVISGTPVPNDDVAALAWFPAEALPPDEEIAFANVPNVLRAWKAGR